MSEETCLRGLAIALVAVMIAAACAHPALAQGDAPPDTTGLSPYWEYDVRRWEHIITRYADLRGLDADLIASVIWKESRGVATVEGPTGAVGLMCVKPFPWRPSAEELEKPWTNISAGTRTLAHIIYDGHGDIFYALAAYNGGWDQVHLPVTRAYAAAVLDHYVRAVAVEHGLPPDADWVAVFSAENTPDHTTVTVLRPHRQVNRYTERPWSRPGVPTVPQCCAPHATVAQFDDGHGREARIELWLLDGDPPSVVGDAASAGLTSYRPWSAPGGVAD